LLLIEMAYFFIS